MLRYVWLLRASLVLSCNPVLCPSTSTGDGVCDSVCNTPDCHFDEGDCVPPVVIYVSTTPSSTPDGSFSSPFNTLISALEASGPDNTLIYLLEGVHEISPQSFQTLNLSGTILICTLLCTDSPVPGCASTPSTLQLRPSHLQLCVSGHLILLNVSYRGGFELVPGCTDCITCPDTNLSTEWTQACEKYSESVLFDVKSASLSLYSVQFHHLRHQLHSLISAIDSDIYLHNVTFTNLTVHKLPQNALISHGIITLSASGRLNYTSGSVEYLNHGFLYSESENRLPPFIFIDNLQSITINFVEFHANFQPRALIYIRSFSQIYIKNCIFRENLVFEGNIFVDNTEKTQGNANFSVISTEFRGNLGRRSSALMLNFEGKSLNVTLEKCIFSHNFAQKNAILTVKNDFLGDLEGIITLKNLLFEGNQAPKLIFLSQISNLTLTEVEFTSNGDLFPTEILILDQFLSVSMCEMGIFLSEVTQITLSNASFSHNFCPNGSPGITIEGKKPSHSSISGLFYLNNTGYGLFSLLSNQEIALFDLTCIGNSNQNSLNSVCLYLNPVQAHSISITNSTFRDNYSLASPVSTIKNTDKLDLTHITVVNNTAKTINSAIKIAVSPDFDTKVTIKNSLFRDNSCNSSGALFFTLENNAISDDTVNFIVLILNTDFERNKAELKGAAVTLIGHLNVKNSGFIACNFEKNENNEAGAGVYVEIPKGNVTFDQCVFRENKGKIGAGICYKYSNIEEEMSFVGIKNCIFERNSGQNIVKIEEIAKVYNSFCKSKNNTVIFNQGSGFYMANTRFSDENSVFLSNIAEKGVGLFIESSIVTIKGLIGRNNTGVVGGGVVYFTRGSQVTLENSHFEGNKAGSLGGCMYIDQDSVINIVNLTAKNNLSGDRGAVMYEHRSFVNITVAVMTNNTSGSYGALFISASTLVVSKADMSHNTAPLRSPGIVTTLSTIKLYECLLHDQHGAKGASLMMNDQSTGLISNSQIWNNTAGSGGALVVLALSVLTMQNSHAWNCAADTDGGFLASRISTINFVNTTVEKVTSTLTFGAVFLLQSTFNVYTSRLTDMVGSAVYGMDSVVLIENSYFARVFAGVGAGLNCAECKTITITNSTFSGGQAKVGGVINSYTKGTTPKPLTSVFTNNRFEHSRAINGGAIASDSFYLTLINNTFVNNSAGMGNYPGAELLIHGFGGAVYAVCPSLSYCQFEAGKNRFEGNKAEISGGGIYWADSFPNITDSVMVNNEATYGQDVASYAVRLALISGNNSILPYLNTETEPLIVELVDIGSGHVYNEEIFLALVDQYDHIVTTDDASSAQMSANSSITSVSGNTQVIASLGVFLFTNMTFIGPPTTHQSFTISTNGINPAIKSTARDPTSYYPVVTLLVHFRECQVGESLQNYQCVPCPVNTFSLNPKDTCMSCPDHVKCYGMYFMVPEEGYWRPDPMVNLWFECLNRDACGGSPDAGNLSLTGVCGVGYTGNLCNTCEHAYSSQGGGVCSLCPTLTSNVILTSFLILLFLCFFSIIVYISIRGAQKPRSELAIFMKILLNYMQMVMVASSLNINWPAFVDTFLRGQQMAGNAADQLMSIECILKQVSDQNVYYTNLAVYVAVPGAMMGLCVLFWLSVSWKVERAGQKLVASLVLVIFVLHTSLTKAMFSIFTCRELLPSEYWLVSNLSIRCWDRDHIKAIFTLAIPGITVWIVGLPTVCMLVLIAGRNKLGDIGMRVRFSFLFKGYRAEWYFWEFVILYRKIIVVCTSVFLTTVSVVMQALSMLAVVLICLFLQQYVQPFFGKGFNSLELKALLASLLTIYSGLYFETRSTHLVVDILIFTVILAANGYFLLTWARHVIPIIILTLRERINAIRKFAVSPMKKEISELEKGYARRPSTPEPSADQSPVLPDHLTPPHNTSYIAEQSDVDIP